MDDTALDWSETGPRNARTGDVYFSPRDGLAETRHTFIGGCGLPDAWAGRRVCTIGEIGFGTGLNFLGASTRFLDSANDDQHLYYVAFEKFPLSADQAARALTRWKDELPLYDTLIAQWPMRVPGFHYLPLHPRVTLLIVHDDAAEGLSKLVTPHGIDSWFLDGFAPARDPSAWHQDLYDAMAAHSHSQTRLASFTAVSTVRKGLAQAGFKVKREKGYGYKWHMTTARFENGAPRTETAWPQGVNIQGGGLAGSACAQELSRFGVRCRITDPDINLDKAASGNPFGAIKPRLTAKPSVRSEWYVAGYSLARRVVPLHLRHAFPALHLNAEADLDAYGWHPDHLHRVENASDIAGIPVGGPALVFPDALLVRPKDLCRHWQNDIETPESFDATIIATGSHYPGIRPVRGQITMVKANAASAILKAMLFYGGYMAPAIEGEHIIGASFERGRDDIEPSTAEDESNLQKLADAVPALAADWTITGHRAAVRANTPDRLPLVGKIAADTYISVGHGSHGLLSAPIAAAVIVAQMLGLSAPVPRAVLKAIAGDRFPVILDATQNPA